MTSVLIRTDHDFAPKQGVNTTTTLPPGGGVKNVIYNFGCVNMQVLENGEI